jgi:catechol 2,3-dioxygenase-like lactoylglutathione lyase family enzyme
MDESIRNVGAITLFVEDPQRSKEYYERVFEATTIYEDENAAAFGFENMIVNTLRRREADELIAPAAVAGSGAPSAFQLTVGVEDADATCAELAGRGVDFLNGPVDRPWGMRTAAFADPDGHVWEVASKLPDA